MAQLICLIKIFFIIAGLSIAQTLPDLNKFGIFHPYVEIIDKKFPAMIVNGLVAATTTEVGETDDTDDIFLCVPHSTEEGICIEVVETVHTFEKEEIALLSVPLEPGLSFFFSLFNMSYNQQCQALSVNHAPISMTVKQDGIIVCDTCQHMDMILCMYQCMGVLASDKTLVPYWKLLEVAESKVGSDLDPKLFGMETARLFERSSANSIANDISPFREDATLLRPLLRTLLSSIIFTSFTLCNLL